MLHYDKEKESLDGIIFIIILADPAIFFPNNSWAEQNEWADVLIGKCIFFIYKYNINTYYLERTKLNQKIIKIGLAVL